MPSPRDNFDFQDVAARLLFGPSPVNAGVITARAAKELIASQGDTRGIAIDFTDGALIHVTGRYGSARVAFGTSGAETLIGAEPQGLAIDFTDSLYQAAGRYGSAIRKV